MNRAAITSWGSSRAGSRAAGRARSGSTCPRCCRRVRRAGWRSGWRLAARIVRGGEIWLELKRHQPLPATDLPAEPGTPVHAPDWPDAIGTVRLFDLPNIGIPATSAPHILIACGGSNDGWRGADCWFVPAAGAEPISVGLVRPATALGELAEPLAAASDRQFDMVNVAVVTLVNPAMTLESVGDAALLGGANRAMVGGELLQFGVAEAVGPSMWRLSRLLRGRAGTLDETAHEVGEAFVLLDDAALLKLPDALARWAEGGGAMLEWMPRGGSVLTEIAVPSAGRALRPPAPVHGRVRADGAGSVTIDWIRCSRADAGWRDHVDQASGETQERWRIALSPPVPGIGPWESPSPTLTIDAGDMAMLPPGCAVDICQAGDLALSPPLSLPLT